MARGGKHASPTSYALYCPPQRPHYSRSCVSSRPSHSCRPGVAYRSVGEQPTTGCLCTRRKAQEAVAPRLTSKFPGKSDTTSRPSGRRHSPQGVLNLATDSASSVDPGPLKTLPAIVITADKGHPAAGSQYRTMLLFKPPKAGQVGDGTDLNVYRYITMKKRARAGWSSQGHPCSCMRKARASSRSGRALANA